MVGTVVGAGEQAAAAPGTALNTGPFTSAQADAGREVFQAKCARCHGSELQGGVEEPPLAGPRFLAKWRNRTTHDLLNFIQTRMPPQEPGGLGDEVHLQLVAHLLHANGAESGPEPLTSSTTVTIGSIAPDPPAAPAQ